MYKMIGCLLAGLAGGAVVFAVPSGLENVQGRWSLAELVSRPVHPSTSGSVPWFTIKHHAIERQLQRVIGTAAPRCNDAARHVEAARKFVATIVALDRVAFDREPGHRT